jgi:hypothetical protein
MEGRAKYMVAAGLPVMAGCSWETESMLGLSIAICVAVSAVPFLLRKKSPRESGGIVHHSQIASDPLPKLRFCPSCGTGVPRSYLPNACASCGAVFDIEWLEKLPR